MKKKQKKQIKKIIAKMLRRLPVVVLEGLGEHCGGSCHCGESRTEERAKEPE
jgi:hypothetical protein